MSLSAFSILSLSVLTSEVRFCPPSSKGLRAGGGGSGGGKEWGMFGLLWEKSPPEIVVLLTHCVLDLEVILLPLRTPSAPVGPPYSTLHINLESREKYDFLPLLLSFDESPAPRREGVRPEEEQGVEGGLRDGQSSILASTSLFSPSPQDSSPLPSRSALRSSPATFTAPPSLLFSRSPCFGESGPSESESRLPKGEAERLGDEERLSWSISRPLLRLLLLLARLPTTELLLPWDWPSSLSLSRDWLATEVGGGTVEGAELSVECVDVGGFGAEAES